MKNTILAIVAATMLLESSMLADAAGAGGGTSGGAGGLRGFVGSAAATDRAEATGFVAGRCASETAACLVVPCFFLSGLTCRTTLSHKARSSSLRPVLPRPDENSGS